MRKTSLLASLCVFVISAYALAVGGDMGGTDPNGSSEKPYLIEDIDDFDTFADPNNAATYWAAGVHTKLTTDIDLAGRTYTTAVIAPDTSNVDINNFNGTIFLGNFDGNNFLIKNMTIDTHGENSDYLGLFGWVYGPDEVTASASIKNLGLKNITIIGGIDSDYVGGLAGLSHFCSIRNCYTSGLIDSAGYGTGGLVGEHNWDVMTNCYSTCSVSGNENVGGLVGYSYETAMDSCYATGPVNGTDDLGGLMGEARDSNVNNCYATGDTTGTNRHVGGLLGVDYNSTVTNCYAIGLVNGADRVGGLMGWSDGIVFNNYWDIDTSGTTDGVGSDDPDPAGVMGKTTAEMMTQGTFTDAGWDFVNTWFMSGYPALSWQADLGGGDGSQANPYLIENLNDFDRFAADPAYWAAGVHTKLMTDIDLGGRTYTTAVIAPDTDTGGSVSSFVGTAFSGVFDGNDLTVGNLTVENGNDYIGLFGEINSGAEVNNLGVVDVNVFGGGFEVGALSGRNMGSISNCYSTGVVSGGDGSSKLE